MFNQDLSSASCARRRLSAMVRGVSFVGLCAMVAVSAIVTKEAQQRSALVPLAQIKTTSTLSVAPVLAMEPVAAVAGAPIIDPLMPAPAESAIAPEPEAPAAQALSNAYEPDTSIRYFNGRPVRPARTIRMTVTAYSPDERSCAGTADGITSSNHDVFTNAMKLVAADSKILPLGSIISVPGYDDGRVVPVLDRGGAIKGHRLDVLYPTHEIALKWGVRSLEVTVWEYADGLPADDYRKIRDSK